MDLVDFPGLQLQKNFSVGDPALIFIQLIQRKLWMLGVLVDVTLSYILI